MQNNENILNFIYFTKLTKQVVQLILIMLVGTDVCLLRSKRYSQLIVFQKLKHPFENIKVAHIFCWLNYAKDSYRLQIVP